jgi:hypothetical protein
MRRHARILCLGLVVGVALAGTVQAAETRSAARPAAKTAPTVTVTKGAPITPAQMQARAPEDARLRAARESRAREFQELHARVQQEVATLSATAAKMPYGPARESIEAKVRALLLGEQQEFYAIQARWARSIGDNARAAQLDAMAAHFALLAKGGGALPVAVQKEVAR